MKFRAVVIEAFKPFGKDILLFRLDIKLKDHGYSSPYNLKCK